MAQTLINNSIAVKDKDGYAGYTFRLEVIMNSYNSTNSTYNVTINHYAKGDDATNHKYNGLTTPKSTITAYVGSTAIVNQSVTVSAIRGYETNINSWTGNIQAGADGNLKVRYVSSYAANKSSGYLPKNNSNDMTIAMPTIPRYATITSFTVNKKDEHSLNVSWYANVPCNAVQYQIRQSGGSFGNWIGASGNSFDITGLTAGVTYIVKIQVRRTDSGLWTQSGDVRQATHNYPYVSSTPNFVIGDILTIGLYNPLHRNVTVYLQNALGEETTGKETTIETVSGYTEETYTNFLYQGIPNSKSGQYSVRLVCETFSIDTTIDGGIYTIQGNEKPIFSDFVYTDINPITVALSGSTDQNPIIIKGYSTVKATISAANKAIGTKYANIDKYVLSDGNNSAEVSYSSDSDVVVTLQNFSNEEISLAAVDKRGLSTIIVKDCLFKDYNIPIVDNLTLTRNDGGVGQYGYISFNGEFWNSNFGVQNNGITDVSYWYKEMSQGEDQWVKGETTITPTTSDNTFTVQHELIDGPLESGGFDQTKTYDIKITVTDKLGTSTEFKATMVNAQPGIAIYNNCVSICTSYDTALGGILQVNHGIVRDGHLLYNNTSGDNGDITLNDTVDNYLYIEVYYRSNDGYYGSQKIYEPNNKTIMLLSAYRWSDFYLKYKSITIVDDTISTDQYAEVDIPHQAVPQIWGNNYMYIVQVIGYK